MADSSPQTDEHQLLPTPSQLNSLTIIQHQQPQHQQQQQYDQEDQESIQFETSFDENRKRSSSSGHDDYQVDGFDSDDDDLEVISSSNRNVSGNGSNGGLKTIKGFWKSISNGKNEAERSEVEKTRLLDEPTVGELLAGMEEDWEDEDEDENENENENEDRRGKKEKKGQKKSKDQEKNSKNRKIENENENDQEIPIEEFEIEEVPQNQSPFSLQGKGTPSSSVVNLINTIIGGGVLALPFAFKTTGLILGFLFLLVVYILTNISLYYLTLCCQYIGKGKDVNYTPKEIGEASMGFIGAFLSDLALILNSFGIMCSYLVITCDISIPIFAYLFHLDQEDLIANYRPVFLVVILLLLLPLTFLKRIDSLKFTSYAAMVSILYIVILVVVTGFKSLLEGNASCDGCLSLWKFNHDFARVVPIMTLSLNCQMNFFSIYRELKEKTTKRMTYITVSATTLSSIAYLTMGWMGYISFLDETRGNILLNFPVDSGFAIAGRFAVAVSIATGFPLMSHPCITSLLPLIRFGYSCLLPNFHPTSPYYKTGTKVLCFPIPSPHTISWITVSIILSIGSLLVALLVSQVEIIFSFIGATAGTMVGFILPSLYYISLRPQKWKLDFSFFIAAFLCIFGLFFMIYGSFLALFQ